MPARKPPPDAPAEGALTTEAMVQSIMLDRHNEDLHLIIEACTLQIMGDKARVSWWIIVEGEKILEEDLTVDESIEMEDELGIAWANIGPGAAARHYKAIASIIIKHRHKDIADPAAHVGKFTRRQCSDSIGQYTADPSSAAPS